MFYTKLQKLGEAFAPLFLLGVRLFWGWQFLIAGLGKFEDISQVAHYFQQLHIPFPVVNAYLVSCVEFVGGALILMGLFSRAAAVALATVMFTVFFTAEKEVTWQLFSDPLEFIKLTAFTFFMAMLTIFSFGPGYFSADRFFEIDVAKK